MFCRPGTTGISDVIVQPEEPTPKVLCGSFASNPHSQVYKKARNLIVDLYRRDVRRRLTFTDVRRHVAGDAAALQRVFEFLEEWGLVNFQAPGGGGAADADYVVAPDGACPGAINCPAQAVLLACCPGIPTCDRHSCAARCGFFFFFFLGQHELIHIEILYGCGCVRGL